MAQLRLLLGFQAPLSIQQTYTRCIHPHPDIAWVPAENLHVTAYFLDTWEEEALPNIIALIELAIKTCKAPHLQAAQLTLAPPQQPARMIWVRYSSSARFQQLADKLHFHFSKLNPSLRHRKRVIPHMTLARKAPETPPWEFAPFEVDPPAWALACSTLTLWSSLPGEPFSTYQPLASFTL